MLTLKSLTLQNIGRFTESQTIDFTQLGSLVQVDGQNNNTGGSSGSGKSTIFKALEFLLGLNDISNSVLQSRLTKESIFVAGEFDFDGLSLKIERGKKLLIDLNGEVTTGSSKLTEEKLDQIIGMPRDLFRKILHKRQGEGGFFLDMAASETHKFLTSCLGLDKEQEKILVLDNKATELTKQESAHKSSFDSNKMALEATQSAIASLGLPPVLEIAPEALQTLKNAHTVASDTHNLVKVQLKAEMDEFEKTRPQVTSIPFDRSNIERLENEIGIILAAIAKLEKVEQDRQSAVKSKISELQITISNLTSVELARQSEIRSKISSIKTEVSQLLNAEQTRQSQVQSRISTNKVEQIKSLTIIKESDKAKEEAIKLAEELKKVRLSICPTCEQGWVNDAVKAKEVAILTKLQEYKKTVISGMEAANKLNALKKEQEELDLEAAPRNPDFSTFEMEIKQLELDLQPKISIEVTEINMQIDKLKFALQPQAIPEALELKLKVDFKNKELSQHRQEERDHQFKENAKAQLMAVNWAQKQTELRQAHENTVKYVRDEENKALSDYESAKNKVRAFEESQKRYNESHHKLNEQAKQYQNQANRAFDQLTLLQEEIELIQEAKKAIKSYLSCSFEDALDSIGDAATRLIRSIPNMATATIQFEGLKETKEGKIKEEVTCLISMDGEIGIPVKSLSGGERSSVDIGIDLSVIKFIEERTGKGIDLAIFDEAFNGLDSTCIQEAIEMLKESSVDKRLFLVEHNPVISQSIENKITVVRDGLTSKVVQQ